ncbi:MAG: ABC transporter ATP-binding protein [Pseudomonadota bacterium]
MDALNIIDAGFCYGNTAIFENVNISIPEGGTFCILGPNGCGKTTLVDAVLGILRLNTGQILLNNQNINQLSPHQIARQMAYVPQKHNRHFSFSVMDVLLMGRTAYTSFFESPGPEDRAMAEHTLESFDLTHLKNRDYTQLSGGETQLVMIMRALVQDTPVIVMDEPTAHLDFKHELSVLETIVQLVKKKKRTLIMATHFPNHAFYLENEGINVQVAFMKAKKVIPAGSPSTALTEKNIETYYGVKTCVISHPLAKNRTIKQIIPLQTKKEIP